MPDLLSQNIDIAQKNLALRQWTSIVFKKDSTYYARKFDGSLISSSTAAETVIQAALNLGGDVYISDNRENGTSFGVDYNMSGSFSGLTITSYCRLVMGNQVYLNVPNNYTGVCLLMNNTDENSSITGGNISEQTSNTNGWTGLKMLADSAGSIIFSDISNIRMYNPGTGIELECSSSQWINDNHFRNISIFNPTVGVLFDQQSGEISENNFHGVNIQSWPSLTTNGFKDINGTGNLFVGCTVWDIDTTGSETNIKSTATGTQIIGGRMTGHRGTFVDLGTKTFILDVARTSPVSNVIVRPDVAKTGNWFGSSATGGDGIINGQLTAISTGTPGSSTNAVDTTGTYRIYDTGATINSTSGLRGGSTFGERITNFYFKTAVYIPTTVANIRVFAGIVASTAAPASSADPLNALQGIALWYDSAVNANWRRYHNDSSGAGVSDDTSLPVAANTLYPVEIYAVDDTKFRFVFNGTSTDVSSDIPASTTNLNFRVYLENTTAASRTLRCYYITIRNDK